ncbi:hypothetical protein QU593_17790 [Rossellomorea marisflavi]|uniref:hypothetical protein n=1 Tax=Rossellomorea marisflavi TaxID=189381 RepID=UPI0025B09310|nr:hypothetical protein [Rossellomorea marisflavi]WJV17964.1 hypothetical protein QU593_17790 [Rossellomorea marisflavi]
MVNHAIKKFLLPVLFLLLLCGCGGMEAEKTESQPKEPDDASSEKETAPKEQEDVGEAPAASAEGNASMNKGEKGEESEGKAQFMQFIAVSVPAIGQQEMAIRQKVQAGVDLYEMNGDKEAAREALDEGISEYGSLVNQAESLPTESDELKPVKEELVNGFKLYRDTLDLIRKTIDDPTLSTKVEEKTMEYGESVERYRALVDDISKGYGIDYELAPPS